jgi:hypothetical protein
MTYLNTDEIEYCKAHQEENLMKYIGTRLILNNTTEEEYLAIMEECFPKLNYRELLNKEVIPKLAMDSPEYEGFSFKNFVVNTPLATLKISCYSDWEKVMGISTNTKDGIDYTVRYLIKVIDGRFYESILTVFEDKNGEQHEMVNTKLKFVIHLRIKYAYMDGKQTMVVYRIGRDKEDRIEEITKAVNTIKDIYHLSPKDAYHLMQYFDDVIPDFLKFDKPEDSHIAVIYDTIKVNYPVAFNEKEVLEALIHTYNITSQKEIMSVLSLYIPITVFSVQLRKADMIMPLPIILGKGGMGKSAMVKLIVVTGFGIPENEKSEDDIFTKASFRETFSKGIFPILIDEITQQTMLRIYGSMKTLSTGRGSHSRGRPSGGLNEWVVTSVPVFTSNEMIYIDSGMERRFLKLIANDIDNNIQEWRKAKEKIPEGYQYIFLKELDGVKISDMISGILKYVQKDVDFAYAYQMYVKEIMDKVFRKYGLECPFTPIRKTVTDDDDWYITFGQFVTAQYNRYKADQPTYLDFRVDYDYIEGDKSLYVSKLGFQKFLKMFSRCPYRNANTFAINAPDTEYEISYVKKRVCSSKNPIHVIKVREKGEEVQAVLTVDEQLKKKLKAEMY